MSRLHVAGVAPLTLIVVVLGCGDPVDGPVPQPPPPISVPDGFRVEIFAEGLELPTSIAFPPDGSNRLFVNELQSGAVRIIEDGMLLDQPFAVVETNIAGGFPVDGENGLLGIAFDPEYSVNRYVYLSYATRTDAGTFGTVARFVDVDNRGEDFTVLLDGVPSAEGHQIESLAFGPDAMLYVSTGDAFMADEAQNVESLPGKILRMNRDGGIPADNPFPDSYTYALGIRNGFDLVFDDTGRLFSSDNGPEREDELNEIFAEGNYGWPIELGESSTAPFVPPLHVWFDTVTPAGMVVYRGTQFPAVNRGKLFLVLFGDTFAEGPSAIAKRIQVVDVSSTPPTFEDFAVYDYSGVGNPLDIAEGPDGSLYLTDIFQGRIFKISYGG